MMDTTDSQKGMTASLHRLLIAANRHSKVSLKGGSSKIV
jgi:hypothetical protein